MQRLLRSMVAAVLLSLTLSTSGIYQAPTNAPVATTIPDETDPGGSGGIGGGGI